MKRLATVILAVLLCGTAIYKGPQSIQPESETAQAETIHYADISGDYLFIQNFDETERMLCALQDYLGNDNIRIQASVPDDAVCYAESTWDPARVAAFPEGGTYCVEAWDIFKNGEFQKTTYLAGKI